MFKAEHGEKPEDLVQRFFLECESTQASVLELFCPAEASEELKKQCGPSGEILRRSVHPESLEKAWKFLKIMDNNFYTIADGSDSAAGSEGNIAVYSLGCLMNHSCIPNLARHVDSEGVAEWRALVPIAEGDEVCPSYLNDSDLLRSTPYRMSRLYTLPSQ